MSVPIPAAARFPWPPVIYVGATVVGIVLTSTVPLPWISEPMAGILFAVGWLMVAATVALYVATSQTLSKVKTTILSPRMPEHLVTNGPFGFTRNPVFVADTMLLIGIGLINGALWFLPLAVIAAFLTQKIAIEREERHFERHFGKKYRDYAKRVRRWV